MTDLITVQYNNLPVFFQADGFINASEIAKKFGKRAPDYLKSHRTKDYIQALRTRKIVLEQNQLVIVKNGGNLDEHGTWLHPKLAIDFARWLSPDFAVWCDIQIETLLHPSPYGLKDIPADMTLVKQSFINDMEAELTSLIQIQNAPVAETRLTREQLLTSISESELADLICERNWDCINLKTHKPVAISVLNVIQDLLTL